MYVIRKGKDKRSTNEHSTYSLQEWMHRSFVVAELPFSDGTPDSSVDSAFKRARPAHPVVIYRAQNSDKRFFDIVAQSSW